MILFILVISGILCAWLFSFAVKKRSNLALFVAALFLGFIAIEILFRLALFIQYRTPENAAFSVIGNESAPYIGYQLKPNTRDKFLWRQQTTFSTNNDGFRGTTNYGPKEAGEYRIVLLGESSVFGHTATSDETSLGPQLQKKLEAFDFADRVTVINAGNPGHASLQALLRLQTSVLKHEPDLVILYLGWNDWFAAGEYAKYGFKSNYTYNYNFLRHPSWQTLIVSKNETTSKNPILQQLATTLLLQKLIGFLHRGEASQGEKSLPSEMAEPTLKQFYENLSSMAGMLKYRKIPMVWITLFSEFDLNPEGRAKLNDVIRRVASESNSVLLDVDKIVREQKIKGITNPEDLYHITDQGNEFLTQIIAESLQTQSKDNP